MRAFLKILALLRLVRYLGIRWAWWRAYIALTTKTGLASLKCPRRRWIAWNEQQIDAEFEMWTKLRGSFFFDYRKRSMYSAELRRFDSDVADPVKEADRVRLGEFKYFSKHSKNIGYPPDWLFDPWTKVRLEGDIHWSRTVDFGASDIKTVWEPSRFGWVYTLARAYWRTGDAIYANTFWELLESWMANNQPNSGPNWRCGQEAAFRAMAICFGLWAFEDVPSSSRLRVVRAMELLREIGHRIEGHIGYSLSQDNNHGISEATGIFTLGLLFPWWPESKRWASKGKRLLNRLSSQIVYEDGAFSQHSFTYQRVMLVDYAWCIILGANNNVKLADSAVDRIGTSAHLLSSWVSPNDGDVPNHGPNDGAMPLLLDNADYRDFRGIVDLTMVAVGQPRLWGRGRWDETLLWLTGNTSVASEASGLKFGLRSSKIGGYYGWITASQAVFLHAPCFRHRPAHADVLHCDFAWRGHRIAIDAGTFSYNQPSPFDSGFATAEFHNTVMVDHRGPMDRISRFVWFPWPLVAVTKVAGLEYGQLPEGVIEASHNGYGRMRDPVRHERKIVGLAEFGFLVIDNLFSGGEHEYQLSWLFEDWPYSILDMGLKFMTPSGVLNVSVGALGSLIKMSVIRADPRSSRGWQSRYYLDRTPAISAVWAGRGHSMLFWTAFVPDGCSILLEGSWLNVLNCGRIIYRQDLGDFAFRG